MYRFGRHHGQSDEGTGRAGYDKIGPRKPHVHELPPDPQRRRRGVAPARLGGHGLAEPHPRASPPSRPTRLQAPQALPVRLPPPEPPNPTGYYNPGQQVKVIEGNAVQGGHSGPGASRAATSAGAYSATFVYNQNGETGRGTDLDRPGHPRAGRRELPHARHRLLPLPLLQLQVRAVAGGAPTATTSTSAAGRRSPTPSSASRPTPSARTRPPSTAPTPAPASATRCHRNDLSPKMSSTAAGGSGRATVTGRDQLHPVPLRHQGLRHRDGQRDRRRRGRGPARPGPGLPALRARRLTSSCWAPTRTTCRAAGWSTTASSTAATATTLSASSGRAINGPPALRVRQRAGQDGGSSRRGSREPATAAYGGVAARPSYGGHAPPTATELTFWLYLDATTPVSCALSRGPRTASVTTARSWLRLRRRDGNIGAYTNKTGRCRLHDRVPTRRRAQLLDRLDAVPHRLRLHEPGLHSVPASRARATPGLS